MKIYLDSLIFNFQKFGGVSTCWNEYISRMIDNDVDLTILKSNKEIINLAFSKQNCTKVNFLPEKNRPLQYLKNTNVKIKENTKFIFHSTFTRCCSNKNARSIVTIHDFTHQKYFQGLRKILNNFQKKNAIRHADGIVCVSENTKKDLAYFYPDYPLNRVEVIYNAVGENFKRLSQDVSFEKDYSNIGQQKFLLYVGDRAPYKNFSFCLKILDAIKDFILVVVGKPFSEEEKNQYQKYNKRLINYSGLDDQQLNRLYNKAFAFVYPSLYEGFGIPILEAMQAGCPVIAFQNSSIPEVLGNYPVVIETNDLNATVAALNKLEDKQTREEIVNYGYIQASKFGWDKSYDKLMAFYGKILNMKKRGEEK